jgi:imidazolonepropionase-like amidohydrolase
VWDVILDSIANPNSVARARLNNRAYVADVRRSLEISMNNLRRAVRAGVKIAMGTDSGNAGAIHGALVSREANARSGNQKMALADTSSRL